MIDQSAFLQKEFTIWQVPGEPVSGFEALFVFLDHLGDVNLGCKSAGELVTSSSALPSPIPTQLSFCDLTPRVWLFRSPSLIGRSPVFT